MNQDTLREITQIQQSLLQLAVKYPALKKKPELQNAIQNVMSLHDNTLVELLKAETVVPLRTRRHLEEPRLE